MRLLPKKLTENEARLIMSNADFSPMTPYPGSIKPWKSLCLRCSEIVQPRLNAVKFGNRQCGFCSGSRIKPSVATRTFKSAGITPISDFPGANRPWKSQCNVCKKLIQPTFANVKNGHNGCAYCSGKKVDIENIKDFMMLNNLEPLEVFKTTSSKWKCRCTTCNSIVFPRYDDIKRGQGGCKKCGYIQATNKNRLGSEYAIATMRKAGAEPIDVYQSIDKPWLCRCSSCKKEIMPRLHNIMQGQNPCKYCSGKVVDILHAERVMKDAGFLTLVPFPGTNQPWPSICLNCKRKTSPRYTNVRQGSGCRFCNANSFQADRAALIYLITNKDLNAHKIGVTNLERKKGGNEKYSNTRIAEHRRQGWLTYSTKVYEVGLAALEVEQIVLNWLRIELKLNSYLTKEQMPQGGHTETVDASEIDLSTIWAKVEEFSMVRR